MRILLIIDKGVGCGALPVLIAAMRRRSGCIAPLLLPGAETWMAADLLRELCGQAAVSTDRLPCVDVAVWAPCHDEPLSALPRLPDSVAAVSSGLALVIVPVSCQPQNGGGDLISAGARRTPMRVVPADLPFLGGHETALFAPCPEAVCETLAAVVTPQNLAGTRVLITAGPTAEDLDPVRFLTNRSTGRMGVALALAAWRHGAAVTMVHGPLLTEVPLLAGLACVPVRSAQDMHRAVMERVAGQTVAIMCAAVADFTPAQRQERKIKKAGMESRSLELVRTPDILAAVGALPKRPYLVGFAAESHDLHAYASGKLERKNCDLLCANDITEPGSGFAVATNRITVFARDGSVTPLPLLPKSDVAERIIERVAAALQTRQQA